MSIWGNTLTVCIVVWMAVGQLDSAMQGRQLYSIGYLVEKKTERGNKVPFF